MTLARVLTLLLVLPIAVVSSADPIPPPTLVPNFTPPVEVQRNEIQIIALVDGITELHVTRTGMYWVNGMYAKPGQHDLQNVPTYVNGKAWFPKWHKPEFHYGMDRCDPLAIAVPSLDLALELIAVGEKPDASDIEPRSPISLNLAGDELIITIPDPEYGSRWYHFALVPATKK